MSERSFCRGSVCVFLIIALLFAQSALPFRAMAWGEFTLKDEKELGDKFNVLIRSRLPIVQDPEIAGYAGDIVKRLSKSMPPQPFPFTVSVIRHNAINAFACPGGYIFVHTGLILAMDNESEVAGVIAHEMAHVTQRHIAGRIENSQYMTLLSLVGMLAGVFLGGQGSAAAMAGSMAAAQSAMLNYSRNDEREADQVGMNYLTKTGYSPQGMVSAFEILSRKQWLMGSDIPSYLSTHPGLAERVKDMNQRVARLPSSRQTQKDDNTRFLRVQALIRARYSDPAPAAQAFGKQMNGPNRCNALMGMGILMARQNRVNDAARYFDDALACAPDDQLIVREAGRFHYTKGNKDRGAALLSKAVAMNRDDIMALYFHARNLGDTGKTQEALRSAKEILRKVPDDAEVHELIARLHADSRQMFLANLHMAYNGLYANNKRKCKQFRDQAEPLAKSQQEKQALELFDELYKEREAFWK